MKRLAFLLLLLISNLVLAQQGGGGSPGGSNFSIQYKNGTKFGGTGPGTSGQVLTSNGSGLAPTFQPVSGAGTVTSVGLSVPSGLSVSGSPITGSGVLAISTALNGVLKGTGSAFTTATSSDISGLWTGTCNSTTALLGDGTCGSINLASQVTGTLPVANGGTGSTFDLSSEIMADSPTAYWKCNETSGSTLADSSGHGYNLTTVGSPSLAYTYLPYNLTDKFMFVNGVQGGRLTTLLGTSPPLVGDWTIEAIVRPNSFSATTLRIFSFDGPTSGSTDNTQILFYLTSTGTINVAWEQGSGSLVTVTSSVSVSTMTAYHIAAIKDGTAKTVTFFVNGRKVSAVTYANEPTGGTSASMAVNIGMDTNGNGSSPSVIGYVAFFNTVKLSEARIRAHAVASTFMVGG